MSPLNLRASAETAYLGLGANLGDRRANLAEALRRLNRTPGLRVAAVSSIYATAPVGLEGPEFLNAAARVESGLAPEELLDACLTVECELGRARGPVVSSRPIDIDILAYGSLSRIGGRLRLPHPRLTGRAFALAPLAELVPGLEIEGRTVAAWLAAADRSGIRRLEGPALWPAG